ncbi:MAG TPA: MXAN_5187 C-terminal domain-containing protein, partial [Myxococcota bacterium]|nr:MXAN_5187 C-terminal domain-containing protein [Myxococcota bacterium]
APMPEPARPAPRPVAPPPVETPPRPVPAAAPPRPVPTAEGGGKGPRVSMPTDLANFFGGPEGDEDATSEVSQAPPPAAFRPDLPPPPPRPAPAARTAVPPPTTAPMAFDPSQMGQLDGGEEEEDVRSSDYRPDATVVAQIPDELLKQASDSASAEPSRGGVALPPPRSAAISGLGGGAGSEDAHFKETFELFLQTKKQCGEPTAGLTYEKFAEKLKANTAELKSRYRCASVRFQVYVKNGKAALKATPVK